MTFPGTIPDWLLNSPAIPECPSWCFEPTGHRDLSVLPGDWTRFHLAYRQSFPTAVGQVTVEVASHGSWEGHELAEQPARVDVINAEGLSRDTADRLLVVLGEAVVVLARISRVQA